MDAREWYVCFFFFGSFSFRRLTPSSFSQPDLVAVSKLKGTNLIQAAYDEGHRIFGENYVQEIVDKAPKLPKDIQWHFIGHLQSNKCNTLIKGVPNLHVVETVDKVKLANKLNKACESVSRDQPLNVFVQVNTSGEESKSGCKPEACVDVVKHVQFNCKHLRFVGLMTIGRYGDTTSECFEVLCKCRDDVLKHVDLPEETQKNFQMSMGMSGDFPLAIKCGSTNVRVGSSIFGART